ncbi:TetR/AcrR family transcriptional regulator [Demequina sp. SO4-13]|uniref:TetR/AcrR family transcriptional regulator n=1 Tax=Demequina sp. SO4-13 TaxID=3401027 RepID=UPI003AF8740E
MTAPQNDGSRGARAPRMSPADRRASILDAAIPLILEHGAEVTTRQIADAACIAEGTVFRAFVDKNELIDAAVGRVMDPAELLAALERIDPAGSLPDKLDQIVALLHARMRDVVAFMGALGPRDHARHRADAQDVRRPVLGEATSVIHALLEPDRDRIRVPIATAIDLLRVLVFGTSVPFLRDVEIDPATLSDFILRGIAAEGQ